GHGGTQRPHGAGGGMDIAGFQQPGNTGFPCRHAAQDDGALGNRLVAGDRGAAFEGTAPAGAAGAGSRGLHGGESDPYRGAKPWQTRPSEQPFFTGTSVLVKADLGTKRACPSCNARFYDLEKRPIECPKCGFSYEPEALFKQRRGQPEPAGVVRAEESED